MRSTDHFGQQVRIDDGIGRHHRLVAERAFVAVGAALSDDRVAGGLRARARGGGDGHDRGQKVIATAFADIGFDVDVGQTSQEGRFHLRLRMCRDSDQPGRPDLAAGGGLILVVDDDRVMLTPHLGASTAEAEENCAVMAADQLIHFLETGSIVNSVNFPAVSLERVDGFRIAVTNRNVPGLLGDMTSVLAERNINVIDLVNKSRGDIAYNIIDVESEPGPNALEEIRNAEGVIRLRSL